MLAFYTLQSPDPKVLFDCVFQMCDSDGDGQLTKAELVNTLYAYCNMVAGIGKSEEEQQPKHALDEIEKEISAAFGERKFVGKKDIRYILEKSEILQSMFMGLHTATTLGLVFDDTDF